MSLARYGRGRGDAGFTLPETTSSCLPVASELVEAESCTRVTLKPRLTSWFLMAVSP